MTKVKQKKRSRRSKSCINITISNIGFTKKPINTSKKLNLLLNMSSTGLIIIGTVAGGLTANPAVIGSITGAGSALKTFFETKDFKKKIEMARFSYTTYDKVLVRLRTSLRGGTFSKHGFLKEMTVLDETVVDFAPLVTRFEKQYAKKFLSGPTETK